MNKILSLKNKSLKYGLNATSFLYDFSKSLDLNKSSFEKEDYDSFLFFDKNIFFDNIVEECFFYKNDFLKVNIDSSFNDSFVVENNKNYFFVVSSDKKVFFDFSKIDSSSNSSSQSSSVSSSNFSSNFFVFILEEGVNFDFKNIYFNEENFNDKIFVFKFLLKKNSVLNFNQLFVSKKNIFLRNKFFLEENAVVNPSYSIFTFENSNFDFFSDVFHLDKNSNSDMKVNSVCINNSKSIIQGNIRIFPEAFFSNGYQQLDNIILDSAVVIPIPNLEIHNNEVKCSHGSTTTTLDDNLLFYLQSRGIPKKEAFLLLLSSFLNSNLFLFDDKELEFYTDKIKKIIILEEKL